MPEPTADRKAAGVPADPASPILTVDEAVASALRRNPRLAAVAGDIAAARSGVKAAGALTNPDISFTPAITGPGGSDTEVLVQQPLEINGVRRARAAGAQAQLRAVNAGAVVELRNLVFQTKSAYYELERAREQQALARAGLETAQEFDAITRQQVEAGARPGIDQIQTGIEVTRARQQVVAAERQVVSASTELNTLMGMQPDAPIGGLSDLSANTPLAPVDLTKALASRAEITREEANRDVFLQAASQARAEGNPDLTPQFRAGSVTRGGIQESGIGLGISLPLFDYGGRRSRIKQAEQSAKAQEARISAARAQVRKEVAQASEQAAAADAVVQDFRKGVLDQARQLLDATRTGFTEGQTSIVALLEAQRTYRSVLTDYINALVDAAIARAELERATGAVSSGLLPSAGSFTK